MSKTSKTTKTESIAVPSVLPVLTSKDIVPFPGVTLSLLIGRSSNLKAIEAAMASKKIIFMVAQRNPTKDEPVAEDLYITGVVGTILRVLPQPDGKTKLLIQGLERAKVKAYTKKDDYFIAKIEEFNQKIYTLNAKDIQKPLTKIKEYLEVLISQDAIPEELLVAVGEVEEPGMLADMILAHQQIAYEQAQKLLEEPDSKKRLQFLETFLADEVKRAALHSNIRSKAKDELEKDQKDYFLREQIRQINRELGEPDEDDDEEDLKPLREEITAAKLPQKAKVEAELQLKRLERMHPEASEYAVVRTYLEWLGALPWSVSTQDNYNLKTAKRVLDKDHFGLAQAKDRIIEYLSVRKLNPDSKGPILCFVGPPGVGKTSLGRSIATALGRKFFRFSLGGMRDEAEIRGHRRTYVGALPGRIIQGLRQVGTKNPVIVLDELDKVGADFRGDPAAALLEVLDPQQNKEFSDHYLGVDFDLSEILFVATANTLDTIPAALHDRLEIIEISGYTTEEKLAIAKKHLVPRQLQENGLVNAKSKSAKVAFTDDGLLTIISSYTREAGVRNLEREIGSICRKVAREVVEKTKIHKVLNSTTVKKLLGMAKMEYEDKLEKEDSIGLVKGLAWTTVGGEILPIEVSVAKGTGQLHLTGQLGGVMKESAQTAMFYTRANAEVFGIEPNFHAKHDIHIHMPNGATPKDGPSAGIAVLTALVSVLTERKAYASVAMTGEVTLRGNVLPIGGLKEKLLAAIRRGIKTIIIPAENKRDLEEVPKEQLKKVEIKAVSHINEVLGIALYPSHKKMVVSPRKVALGIRGKVVVKR